MLAIVVLLACAVLAARLDPLDPPVAGRARISDGDSFHLGAERIRLLGIDAPELDQTCTDPAGANWPCGGKAREVLAKLVSGKTLNCQPDGQDRFGRILATCSAGTTDLGSAMVAAGMAISADAYDREEAAARAAGLGLWAGSFEQPRAWRDRHGREAEGPSGWSWLPRL